MVFGDCCKDLSEVLNAKFNSHFYVTENEVLYMAVGHVVTDEGPGWFDQAVMFCPFCGTRLQTSEDVAGKTTH